MVFGGIILVASAAIRLYRLDHFSYGLDEVLQGFWIRGTWAFFWKSLRFDAVHPPLDYLVSRGIEQLDPVPWARKLPAVLWGVGTVAALGTLVGRRAGRTAGLLAALLLAFAPFHVRYSQELRPYSLALLLLCLSLLALDRLIERPNVLRLAVLYLASLATAYALYLAALVLGIAAAAMLVDEAFATEEGRRRTARKLLVWSPLFLAALWLAYLPWWPVVLEASRRSPMAERVSFSLDRADRLVSFFAFAWDDGPRLGLPGLLFVGLVAAGTWLGLCRSGHRFLVLWAWGGLAAIEVLGRLHPHFDFARRFLPAGPALLALAAVAIAELASSPVRRALGALLAAAVLALDTRSLTVYFRAGRADWRPLARFLAAQPAEERIFTENQYSQLCVAYYVCGPDWLWRGGEGFRPVWNIDGDLPSLMSSWPAGTTGWLVLAGEPRRQTLRSWVKTFPATEFPPAEGAVLHRLDPGLRDAAFGIRR
jgi:4-amino-4-deoxy-L-arabinose transferase-like glycosyltransferase